MRPIFAFASFLVATLGINSAVADVRIDLVGQWGGIVYALDFDGTYAYAGVGSRLAIIDLADPEQPRLVGQTEPLGHLPTAVVSKTPLCFVGLINGGFRVIDVSDPAMPTVVNSMELASRVEDLDTDASLAIVSTENAGLYFLDLAENPPTILSQFDHPYFSGGTVEIHGQYAYCIEGGLRVFDISDAAHPATMGVRPDFHGLFVSRRFDDGLLGFFLNTSDASNVQLEAIEFIDPWVVYEPFWAGRYVEGGSEVAIDGDTLCLSGVSVYTFNGVFFNYRSTVRTRTNWTGSLAVRNGIVCSADGYEGVQIVDIHDPDQPVLRSYFAEANHALRVSTFRSLAFVTGYRRGIDVLDFADPANAERVARWADLDGLFVRVQDDLAVVTQGYEGLAIVDVSEIAAPRVLGRFATESAIIDALVEGSTAFVSEYNDGIIVLDISDPTRPLRIASVDTGRGGPMIKRGDLLYVADRSTGFHIVDVSEPSTPQMLGQALFEYGAGAIALVDDVAFVSTGFDIVVLDIGDPLHPRELQRLRTGGWSPDLVADGRTIQVSTDGGVRVLDVADPFGPRWVGDYRCNGWNSGVAVANGVTLLATDSSGLELLVVREPGDADGNGEIDVQDLALLLSAFGSCDGEEAFNRYTDLDGNGCTTVADLAHMLGLFGG